MTGIRSDQIVVMNQHYKKYSLTYFLDCMERLGTSNLELWMSMPHFPVDRVSYGDCKALRRQLAARGQKIVCATVPSCDFQGQYGMPQKAFREHAVGYFTNGIRAAEELGAEYVTVNSGWGYYDLPREEGIKNTVEILGQLTAEAEKRGLTMVMETLTSEESQLVCNIPQLQEVLAAVDSKVLKVMVDTAAMNDAGETMEDWFEAFGDDVKYMHFIDADQSWYHYRWGEGTLDLHKIIETMNRYGYEGYLSQELIIDEYLNDPFAVDQMNINRLKEEVI
ncbi:MAG: sugar phosphate isomerase/epimerase family protein [Bacillota bacterium]|nr:sugar phosphate isomerase/epimerase family protein [Bacillota bacterium]